MTWYSSILPVLALVLLANQCSLATYQGYDNMGGYGNNQMLVNNYGCIADGNSCDYNFGGCCVGVCWCKMGICRCHSGDINIISKVTKVKTSKN